MSNRWNYCVTVVRTFLYGISLTVPVLLTFTDQVGWLTTVDGQSMRPTLNPARSHTHDSVWVAHLRRRVTPGDVVAMSSPINPKALLVKRVVAIEGELVQTTSYRKRFVQVPPGHCWVEGDNGRFSQDSNFFGPVSCGLVYGSVTHIVWPPPRWGHVSSRLHADQANRRGPIQGTTESIS